MIKAVAILAFAGVASAGLLAAPAYAPAYAAAPVLQKTVAYAQPAYAAAPVLKTIAPQPILRAAPVAYAQPLIQKAIAPVAYAAPVAKAVAVSPEPYDPHPQYNYGYSVSDALTGDSKSAHEQRDGDVVQGQYSLVEPDGAIRTVTYTADPVNGFNAVVDRTAPTVAVKTVAPVVKAVAPVAYAQPLIQKVAAPLAYASPVVAKTIYG